MKLSPTETSALIGFSIIGVITSIFAIYWVLLKITNIIRGIEDEEEDEYYR